MTHLGSTDFITRWQKSQQQPERASSNAQAPIRPLSASHLLMSQQPSPEPVWEGTAQRLSYAKAWFLGAFQCKKLPDCFSENLCNDSQRKNLQTAGGLALESRFRSWWNLCYFHYHDPTHTRRQVGLGKLKWLILNKSLNRWDSVSHL